jgi:hypothetical protein
MKFHLRRGGVTVAGRQPRQRKASAEEQKGKVEKQGTQATGIGARISSAHSLWFNGARWDDASHQGAQRRTRSLQPLSGLLKRRPLAIWERQAVGGGDGQGPEECLCMYVCMCVCMYARMYLCMYISTEVL